MSTYHQKMQTLCRYHLFSVLCGIMILILCVIRIPQNDGLSTIPYIDKIVHFSMYFTFSLLFVLETFRYDQKKKKRPAGVFLKTLLLSFVIGGGIEIIQSTLTDYRTGDIIDLCFDMGGAITGILVSAVIRIVTLKQATR